MIPVPAGASPAQPPADISVLGFMGMGRYPRPQGHKKKWLVGDISVEAAHASCPQAVTWAEEYSDYVLKLQQKPLTAWMTQLQLVHRTDG